MTVATSRRLAESATDSNGKIAKIKPVTITISEPNMRVLVLKLTGTAPYVQCAEGAKMRSSLRAIDVISSAERKKSTRVRKARDYDQEYEEAFHRMKDGTCGVPVSAFRQAAQSACRLVDFKMILAKLSLSVEPDGFDAITAQALVKIHGEPKRFESVGRNSGFTRSPRIVVRPKWEKWHIVLRVEFDADQLTASDIFNLFSRVGKQVGIGEGRPDSKNSCGQGWGTFTVEISKP